MLPTKHQTMKILIIVGALFSFLCGRANASDVCDLALTSGAFNTSDYSQSSNILIKKHDDACKSEYNSQSEAVGSGQQSGGSIGYGGFSLGLSDAKQTSSGKWSISDSKFCHASAEELESFTSKTARLKVTDTALSAWNECLKNANRLYVTYEISEDGTRMRGIIHRSVGEGGGAFGNITGIHSDDPNAKISCTIGNTPIELNKTVNIKFDKPTISISCIKSPKVSVDISISTDVGDKNWMPLPSQSEQEQSSLKAANDAINQLRSQLASLSDRFVTSTTLTSTLSQRISDVSASISYGGAYSQTDGPWQASSSNQFKNPLTGDYSCPPGFTPRQAARYRAAEPEVGANLYVCSKP